MTATYDWTRFTLHHYYAAPRAQVYRSWATAAGLCSFLLERAEHERPDGSPRGDDEPVDAGDRYRWTWRHGHAISGEFLARRDDASLTFTFGGMEVRVDLVDVAGATRLDLLQTGIPDSEDGRVGGHLNCRSCWIFFLTNLQSVLERGLDLRDARPERASSMEVDFPLPVDEPAPRRRDR